MKVEIDLDKIASLGKINEKENIRFRSYLKNLDIRNDELDKLVHSINDDVTKQIDCTKCANCCKSIKPVLDNADVMKFAEGLNLTSEEFAKNSCSFSESEKDKYNFNHLPCPFLKENKCMNYNYRPIDCQSYPHLQKDDFVFRLWGVIDNYSICPIVFNVFEILKVELWNKNWRKSSYYY